MSDALTLRQSESNVELVRRSQRREREAFEELAVRCRPRILAVVRGRVSNGEAEDVVQDVLLRVWEKVPDLRDPQAFPAWLAKLTANACRGWYRRCGRLPFPMDDADLHVR